MRAGEAGDVYPRRVVKSKITKVNSGEAETEDIEVFGGKPDCALKNAVDFGATEDPIVAAKPRCVRRSLPRELAVRDSMHLEQDAAFRVEATHMIFEILGFVNGASEVV